MLKIVFISQPMANRTNEELLDERRIIVSLLLKTYGPINLLDTIIDYPVGYGTPLEYLGESIKYLSQADVAVFCPGWEDARGCRVERLCCEEYGVQCRDLTIVDGVAGFKAVEQEGQEILCIEQTCFYESEGLCTCSNAKRDPAMGINCLCYMPD